MKNHGDQCDNDDMTLHVLYHHLTYSDQQQIPKSNISNVKYQNKKKNKKDQMIYLIIYIIFLV